MILQNHKYKWTTNSCTSHYKYNKGRSTIVFFFTIVVINNILTSHEVLGAPKNWDLVFEKMIVHEGGYVDDPVDAGGCTNYGVTIYTYREKVDKSATCNDIRNLKKSDVNPIAKEGYWDKVKGDDLDSGVDYSMFDWAYNAGHGRANKEMQKIIGTKADGGFGPGTLKAYKKYMKIESMY